MLYYWVPDQMCSVQGVEKLQPGTWAEFRPDGTHRVERYWDVVEEAAAAAEGPPIDLREVVEDSVGAHLVADVPVSSFLSGGLDSSIVTVLAKQANPQMWTPTPSPSGRRTIGSKPCRTTPSTPARSHSATASTCTRSRSAPDVVGAAAENGRHPRRTHR